MIDKYQQLNYKKPASLIFCALLICCFSCSKGPQTETIVYENDFEQNDLTGVTNGQFFSFNNSTVLGRYNNSGFKIQVNDLPEHDLVQISFDLYIHDSWDGNSTVGSGVGGPDIWEMKVDGTTYISTTFSNLPCQSTCSPQSYPGNYSNNNTNPRTGAFLVDLPSVCVPAAQGGGSSLYKISKTIRQTESTLVLECIDQLIQDNAADRLCDESWSVDNVIIKAVTLN